MVMFTILSWEDDSQTNTDHEQGPVPLVCVYMVAMAEGSKTQ